jgi:hypothetical protein
MAKLSQKELEDMAQKRKFADECKVTNKLKIDKNKETGDMPQSKIINDIMGDHNTQ